MTEEGLSSTVEMSDIVKEYFGVYAKYVIGERAIPDVRDGLKPVHRRLIYAAWDMGAKAPSKPVKSAKIIGQTMGSFHPHGDCLRGDTKIFLADGSFSTIKELYEDGKPQDIICIDPNTQQAKIESAHHFRIGQYTNKIFHITLSNGEVISVSDNHPFYTADGKWVRAKNLKEKLRLFFGSLYLNSKRPSISLLSGRRFSIQSLFDHDSEVVHHINGNTHNNSKENLIGLTRAKHAAIHKDYLVGLNRGRESMFNGENAVITKQKNSQVMSTYNKNQALYKAYAVLDYCSENNIALNLKSYEKNRVRYISGVYNAPKIQTLIDKGFVTDFGDLLLKYQEGFSPVKNAKIKCSYRYTNNKKEKQNNIVVDPMHYSLKKNRAFIVMHEMIDLDMEMTLENYAKVKDIISKRDGKGYGNICNRNHPVITSETEFRKLYNQYKKECIYVESIDIEEVDNEPMYDFTVDNYENMLIPVGQEKERYNLICVHNSAIYDTLVRMTQDFSMRIPLFEGQGNFGSIDGDPPAAHRYTEARLFKVTQELFCNDLNDEVVSFVPNYDESTVEPEVLPSELPHLLLNYNTGIAVGLATEIHSCCPIEIIKCLLGEINEDLISKFDKHAPKQFKGPDLATRGIMEHSADNVNSFWLTGKSRWKIRGEAVFETDEKTGNKRVVVTSLPFQEKKEKWLEATAKLITEKNDEGKRGIEGVTDMRDESDKQGIRVVFDVSPSSNPEIVLNLLYQKTNLSVSLSTGIVAIVDGKPKYLGVRDVLLYWLDFRRECMRNILTKEKREKTERVEVVDGLLIVHSNVEKVIKTIREAEDSKQALIDTFKMTDRQASAVVAMRLGSLRKIDNEALVTERKTLQERIDEIVDILSDPKKVDTLIAERLEWWKTQLDGRRTTIVREFGEISALDTVVERDVVVSINRKQEFKVTPIDSYRKIRRGGRGVKETDGEDPDDVPCLLAQVTTHDMLYAFTDQSRVFEKSCHELPITRRTGKRQPLTELFSDLKEDENVVALMAMNIMEMPEDSSVIMIRSNGNVKRLKCRGLLKKRGRLWGDPCCRTDYDGKTDGSTLMSVTLAEPDKDLIIFTANGLFRRISIDTLRPLPTRSSGASKCMTLVGGDKVVSVDTVKEGDALSTVSENGYGVRINESDLSVKKGRVGQGMKFANTDRKAGKIVYGCVLNKQNELFVTTSGGKSIRISAGDIREVGRGSRGVRVQKMGKGEHIVAAAKIEVNGDHD